MNPKDKEKRIKGKKAPRKEDFREKDPKYFKDKKKLPYRDGPNDPIWRTKDEVMTKLVANLPFGIPSGLPQRVSVASSGSPELPFIVPGIASIAVYVTGGNSKDYNSALNLATRKIYSFVRHANSGSRNYEAADMSMYFLAIAQILAWLGFLQRVLRIVNEYSPTNRYKPVSLLAAMGLNFDDIKDNQPQLKYCIAWLGRVLNGLAFPDLPYFRACYEAFKYIYQDNDSPKEQFYVLTPVNIGLYDPTYDSNGGGVRLITSDQLPKPTAAPSAQMTMAQILAYTKVRTDILLGDEDLGLISGDILKAFANNPNGLFKPEAWGVDYEVFLHSPEFLEQVHNLTLIRDNQISFAGYKQDPGSTGTAPFVIQDIGSIGTANRSYGIIHHTIIDAFSREPDPLEVVNCMVLNPQAKSKSNSGSPTTYSINADTLTFDLFLPMGFYVKETVDNLTGLVDNSNQFTKFGTDMYGVTVSDRISHFDWHPLVWYYTLDGSSQPYYLGCYGDIQNIRVFPYDVGQRIHENSILNLLAFSDVNFYSK